MNEYHISDLIVALDAIGRHYDEIEEAAKTWKDPGFVDFMATRLVGVVREHGRVGVAEEGLLSTPTYATDFSLSALIPESSQVTIPARVCRVLEEFVFPYVAERLDEAEAGNYVPTLADARRLIAAARAVVQDPAWHYRAICEFYLAGRDQPR
jgi:hypothetical protein